MATNLTKDYVLLNGAAYVGSAMSEKNQLPVPEGWARYGQLPDDTANSLNATTFQNGNHFVITFPGTADSLT